MVSGRKLIINWLIKSKAIKDDERELYEYALYSIVLFCRCLRETKEFYVGDFYEKEIFENSNSDNFFCDNCLNDIGVYITS